MNNNPNILTNVFGYNEKDVEFERVVNNLDDYEVDYGVEVIFNYYRRHGFPHYTIREDEKHEHMRKIRKFDINTILDDDKIQIGIVRVNKTKVMELKLLSRCFLSCRYNKKFPKA